VIRPSTRFVLVVGCQRSGTTLVGNMLGAHPVAVLVDEDEGAYRMVSAIAGGEEIEPVLQSLLPRARLKYSDFRRVETAMPSHVVLKAPNATFLADVLRYSALPLSFVFVARNVCEVVHSMLGLTHVPMVENQCKRMAAVPAIASRFADEIALLGDPAIEPHVKAATIWRVKTGLYREFCAPPCVALLVRYDDLVDAPEQWSIRMWAHAGMPCVGPVVAHNDVMHGMAIGNTNRGRGVDKASRSLWKETISPSQLLDVRAIAGGLMDELSLDW
jgi:hypothetical protein